MVYNGKSEGVVFSLNKQLSALNWSHTYGGGGYDALYGIALGKASDVYVSGGSSSTDLKVRLGNNWLNNYYGGIADAILLRLDKSSGAMLQGRYHGTNLYEQAHFVQTGQTGKPYIYGQTEANMPNVNARFYQAGADNLSRPTAMICRMLRCKPPLGTMATTPSCRTLVPARFWWIGASAYLYLDGVVRPTQHCTM